MGNSPTYKGNVALHAAVQRRIEQQAADYAAALKTLAEAEAAAAEAIPEALVEAGIIVPARRRSTKAKSAASTQETEP